MNYLEIDYDNETRKQRMRAAGFNMLKHTRTVWEDAFGVINEKN